MPEGTGHFRDKRGVGGCRVLRCPREQSSVKQIISLKSSFFYFFNGNNEIYSVRVILRLK